MKNFWIGIIVLILMTSLVACSGGNEKSVVPDSQFSKYEIQEEDVMNGFGDKKIGVRGYIETDISDISEVDVKDLKTFYDLNVKDKNYNWFNVFLANGNALSFTGGMDMIISYGPTDKDGSISEAQIGSLMLKDDVENPYEYSEN